LRHAGVGHFEIEKIGQLVIAGLFQLVLVGRVDGNAIDKPLFHGSRAVGNSAGHVNQLDILARH